MTHAFVKPGRSHDFVCHIGCANPVLMKAVLGVYGTVERVPMANEMSAEMRKDVCEKLVSKI